MTPAEQKQKDDLKLQQERDEHKLQHDLDVKAGEAGKALQESGLQEQQQTKPLASVKKGEVAADVTFEKGKIVFHTGYAGKGSEAQLRIAIDSSYFLDKLAAKIPGKLDNAAIEMIKLSLAR